MAYMRQQNLFERSGIGSVTDSLVDHFPTPGWSASNMQRGMGLYEHPGNWSWEFFPPPYDFLAPKDSVAVPAPILLTPGRAGLSGCGCGCGGKGTCGHTHSSSNGVGLGLFDTMDFSQWGIGEWATVGFGVYVLGSIFGDFGRARKTVKRVRSRSRAKKRARLEEQIEAL